MFGAGCCHRWPLFGCYCTWFQPIIAKQWLIQMHQTKSKHSTSWRSVVLPVLWLCCAVLCYAITYTPFIWLCTHFNIYVKKKNVYFFSPLPSLWFSLFHFIVFSMEIMCRARTRSHSLSLSIHRQQLQPNPKSVHVT